MKEDKIKAIWEEDGDLMRIKNFFQYLHQDENLKERIKQKTLAKISPTEGEAGDNILLQEIAPESAQLKEKGKLSQKYLRYVFALYKNRAVKLTAVAAVLICAVYLGSVGLQSQDKMSYQYQVAGTEATAPQSSFSAGEGFSSYDTASAPAPTAPDAARNSLDSAYKAETSENGQGLRNGTAENQFAAGGFVAKQDAAGAAQTEKQKLIYSLDVTIKADNVAAAMDAVQKKTIAAGGYVAESNLNNNQENLRAYLVLKIPAARLESFQGELTEFGTVADQHLSTNDVSEQYFDVETRLRSWEAQEKRYLEILRQAKNVEEILKIEDSLANVRREMESLKGMLKFWDNRVDYSEIRMNIIPSQSTLAVNDPWQPISLEKTFVAAKNAIIKTISFIWNALNYLVVFIGYALPVLVLAAIIWGLWFGLKRRGKKAAETTDKKE